MIFLNGAEAIHLPYGCGGKQSEFWNKSEIAKQLHGFCC